MIQVKNNSSAKKVSINWSNGTSSLLDVAGQAGCVANVPEGILEAEVDNKISAFPFIDKLCGSVISEADLEVQYAATEGNDALFTLTPATVSNEDLANSANAHTREVEVQVVTSSGARVSSFNSDVTLTLSASSSEGDISFDESNEDFTAGNSSKTGSLFLRKGYGKVLINCTGVWADDDTNTVTVAQKTYRGITLSAKTSVETIVIA